jgi:hypothetical protein
MLRAHRRGARGRVRLAQFHFTPLGPVNNLTCVCSYSVEGGAASRLGQCAHAFVRTLFSSGNIAGWSQPKVAARSPCFFV